MLVKSIENELLYRTVLDGLRYDSPFLDINEILKFQDGSIEHIIDDYYLINDGRLLKGNNISSSLVNSQILGFRHIDNNLKDTGGYSIYKDINLPHILRKKFSIKAKKSALTFFEHLVTLGPVTICANNSSDINARRSVTSFSEFEKSWEYFSKISPTITIENYCDGDLFSIFIVDGKILGIYGVVPAFVVGDGNSSIADLIIKLNKEREKNILYKDYPLKNVKKNIHTLRVPIKGEIVMLKDSKKIQYGAIYLDVTNIVKKHFVHLLYEIQKLGINRSFLEVQCVSKNITGGIDDSSFYISAIRYSAVDWRHLLATKNDYKGFGQLFLELFPRIDKRDLPMTYIQPDKYYNTHYKYANSVDILTVAAYQLGLFVRTLDSRHLEITHKNKRVLFKYGVSEFTTSGASELTCDKFLTKRVLEHKNINTPVGFNFRINSMKEAWEKVSDYCLNKQGRLVVKPFDGSTGTGVTTDITTQEEFVKSWNLCKNVGSKKVIIEHQLKGDDYRIFVVQNSVCAISQRVPAFVIGDGVHSLKDLIEIKNGSRKKNRFLKTSLIQITEQMLTFLKKRGVFIDDVPKKGVKIKLSEVANASVGGEIIDRTEDMHEDWLPIAVRARKAMADSYHVGLDVMMEDISKSPKEQEWAIIEINTRPDLGVHLFPTEGSPRNIGKVYLEKIFGKIDLRKKTLEVSILGKVKGVGFRQWFKTVCDYYSVVGYVNNNEVEDQVDAVIIGPETALNEVLKLSYTGPKLAKVNAVVWKEVILSTGSEYETLVIK